MKSILLLFIAIFAVGCHTTPSKKEKEAMAEQQLKREDNVRRLQYLASHPDLAPNVQRAIATGDLVAGMSESDARASIGEPDQIITRMSDHGTDERWDYQPGSPHHRKLLFDSGTLANWEGTH